MDIIYILLFSVSMSTDALSLGFTYGLKQTRIPFFAKVVICFISFLTIFIALKTGNMILSLIDPAIINTHMIKTISSLLILFLGVFFIINAIYKSIIKENVEEPSKDTASQGKSEEKTLMSIMIKSIGITVVVIKNPEKCDLDNSNNISLIESIYLGIALSADSFFMGILGSISGINSIFMFLSAGIFQLLFLSAGQFIGKKVTTIKKGKKILPLFSGVLLLVIAAVKYFT